MELNDWSLLIFGAFSSGMIGLFFSMFNQFLKEKSEVGRIAKGFYIEIKDLNNLISPIVEDFQSSGATVGSPYIVNSLFKKGQLTEGQPLYTDNGWYFVFQKDLVLFNHELIESTVLFYRKIVHASALLEEYLEMELATQNQSRAYTVQDNFFESLEIAHDLAPYLLTEFGKYNKKQQVKQWFRFNLLSIIEA